MFTKKTLTANFSRMFILALFFFAPIFTNAATLYFSPSTGSYNVGGSFTASVYVSSTDQAMNAVSGTISFPEDKLSVSSISKTGIISLWVQEPTYSNVSGTVNFEGIVLNPGYVGSGGKVLSVTFRVKDSGVAGLLLTSSSVLANDGQGTNILTNSGSANFSLGGAPAETTNSTVASGAPNAPKITSSTYPDTSKWYAVPNASFEWELPADVTKIRILYDKFPYSQPSVVYDAPLTKREIENVDDGTWYFHAQFSNQNGRGAVSHFRFQVDTEKPNKFEIEEVSSGDKLDSKARFIFDATDALSGIDHFEIKIDDGSSEEWKSSSGNIYETKIAKPGKHTLFVRALDKAGNYIADSIDFTIEALKTPVLDVPSVMKTGETMVIHGSSGYPDATIQIYTQYESIEPRIHSVRTDNKGDFTFINDRSVQSGLHKIWAKTVSDSGAESLETEKYRIAVSGWFFSGISFGDVPSWLLVIMALLLVGALAVYFRRLFNLSKSKAKARGGDAEHEVMRAFSVLREEVRKQVAMLDESPSLSDREKRVYQKLREALHLAEKYITRKIKNINNR